MKLLKVRIGDAEVMNQPGVYKNFTGVFDWKGNRGQVRNANVLALSNSFPYIQIKGGTATGHLSDCSMTKTIFENGTVVDSVLDDVTWKNGTFKDGSFRSGTFKNGTFEDGSFVGTFKGGVFKGGVFDGTFEGGVFDGGRFFDSAVWKNGTWKNGKIQIEGGAYIQSGIAPPELLKKQEQEVESQLFGGENEPVANREGEYKNFSGLVEWKKSKGRVANATFKLGQFGYYSIIWNKGIFKGGKLFRVDWRGGTFERGILNDSLWRRGTWKNGTWLKNWVYDKNSLSYGEERDTPPGK